MLSPVPRDLTSILAARKAQVSQARTQDLIGLRRAGDVDSDDDDDDDDEALESKPQKPALDLGRAANQLASRETDVRKRTLASLLDAELSADQLKPLLRPLLLRHPPDPGQHRERIPYQARCQVQSPRLHT